jgi:hypothetical protein
MPTSHAPLDRLAFSLSRCPKIRSRRRLQPMHRPSSSTKPMERKRDPTPCRRRFCHHPCPHGGIAPGPRGGTGGRKGFAPRPTDAPRPKPGALAVGRDWRSAAGTGPTTRFRRRVGREGFCTFDSQEQSDGSGCYPALKATKGSVDCVHQFRRPLLSSPERPSLQAPLRSRHLTLRHRRLSRSRRDRSRYPGQMSRR